MIKDENFIPINTKIKLSLEYIADTITETIEKNMSIDKSIDYVTKQHKLNKETVIAQNIYSLIKAMHTVHVLYACITDDLRKIFTNGGGNYEFRETKRN